MRKQLLTPKEKRVLKILKARAALAGKPMPGRKIQRWTNPYNAYLESSIENRKANIQGTVITNFWSGDSHVIIEPVRPKKQKSWKVRLK